MHDALQGLYGLGSRVIQNVKLFQSIGVHLVSCQTLARFGA